jgi:hypothetical protein
MNIGKQPQVFQLIGKRGNRVHCHRVTWGIPCLRQPAPARFFPSYPSSERILINTIVRTLSSFWQFSPWNTVLRGWGIRRKIQQNTDRHFSSADRHLYSLKRSSHILIYSYLLLAAEDWSSGKTSDLYLGGGRLATQLEPDYPNWDFSWSSSAPPNICRDIISD